MDDEASVSSEIIERETNDKRAELHVTLNELRGRFSTESVTGYVACYLHGDGGRRLAAAAKANPVAVIMAAAGTGWLLYSARRQADASEPARKSV